MQINIVNGPNLNLLGNRQPEIYGNFTFEDFLTGLKAQHPDVEFHYYQSNVEGELINYLHQIGFGSTHIILNAGGYTHTSVALADAVAAIEAPVVEVHISNILAREEYRSNSLISKHAKGVITGFGLSGYNLAVMYFKNNNG